MNNKLVVRAANHYRKWMQKNSLEPISEFRERIANQIEWLEGSSKTLGRWTKRFMAGMTPRVQVEVGKPSARHIGTPNPGVYAEIANKMVPDLKDRMIHAMNKCESLMQSMVSDEVCQPLGVKEAVQELTIINDAWDEVTYQEGVLSVNIGNVSLDDGNEEIDLGDFILRVNLDSPMGKADHSNSRLVSGLLVEAVEPVYGSGGICHPHVKDGKLCSGDGGDIMQLALRQGRLEDYFRIVEAVMNTYNDDSPYEPLSDWYDPDREGQSMCDVCEEWWSDESTFYCSSCSVNMCENCNTVSECQGCSEWYCQECMSGCEGCGESVCTGCISSCSGCNNGYCKGCTTECSQCSNRSCQECSTVCSCDDEVCQECRKECCYCGDTYCDECLTICEKCGEYACDECLKNCPSCDKEMCTTCVENSCDHCGVPMCGLCESDHECLLAEVSN